MGELLQVLEHLITSGPARNPAELERLLGLLAQVAERFAAAGHPAPDPGAGPVPPAPVTSLNYGGSL